MGTDWSTRWMEPDIDILSISGRLELGHQLMAVESSLKQLICSGRRKVILDLTGLQFIDSAGIGMIVGCGGDMTAAGGQMRIAGASRGVDRIFAVVHLNRIVPIAVDIADAARSFQ